MSNIGKPVRRHEVLPLINTPVKTPGDEQREPVKSPVKEPA